jgi:hypothetical protein
MRITADMTSRKLINVWSQSILGVTAVNPLVVFYNIHKKKRAAILLFCSRHHTINLYFLDLGYRRYEDK